MMNSQDTPKASVSDETKEKKIDHRSTKLSTVLLGSWYLQKKHFLYFS